ncbi:TPA: MetQ/NlpA family ABC transporter substrate-binding protein [Campylobacter jejuni]|nr:MetQ/NlpA family ABC transporter substrate-binding protein [Campylobacter jejuni]HDZ5083851.1 MetQ/NlpA family ABC transporter substrate-binding protein [Campylobacter jejuni]HDZ5084794.1 MetQ/NlpA family ABC transporter substrate-binding protein [Campylobacter jejuni]HDZ5086537.1 MetQ/NlpA family ABC transporter substrate-binding protein [Campylobacter jejuni]HDZ5089563.1 MetQ/NlpA family ABC transporter substrate-binding protein [Campylobacter jejuni]
MNIKKIFLSVLFAISLSFGAEKTITIGATPTPYAEILNFSKPLFQEKGWKLIVKEFNDYNIPNIALNEKDLDANLYQHKPFLDDFNTHKGTKLISLGAIVLVPMAIYSNSIKDIKDIPNGAKIAIPNDPTNESRALDLLAKANLIEFKTQNTLKTPLDISKNPKKLKFIELKAAQLPRALDDVNLAVITTNYALGAGLNPLKDGIFIEDKDSLYAIVLATRKGEETNQKNLVIKEILTSDKIKNFIIEKYKGSVIPTF